MVRRFLIIILLSVSGKCFAQDPAFTQFYANPIYLNPAFAGSARCPRVNLNYRNQWPALTGTFVTSSASYDQYVDALGGGVGLQVLNDRAGESTLTTTTVSAMYAYQLNVTREFSVRFGIEGSYYEKKLDWDKLHFGDEIDPRYGFIYQTQEIQPNLNKNFWDFSAGILGYSNMFYGGIAVKHLTQPEEFYVRVAPGSNLPMKYTIHAGSVIPIAGNRDGTTYISPNFIYEVQRDFHQYDIGFYIAKAPLVGGLWYRGADSFIVLVGLQQGILKFGYSYDVTVSKLSSSSAGSHELSLGLQLGCHPKKKKFRTIKCPAF